MRQLSSPIMALEKTTRADEANPCSEAEPVFAEGTDRLLCRLWPTARKPSNWRR